ncbi:MAG: DUF1232 domain-containing protein, partial [Cyanobacteria bacterium J06636_28]
MKTSAQQPIIESLRNWYRKAIRHSKYRWLVVFGSLLYLISPFDISPDVFPSVTSNVAMMPSSSQPM